MKEVYQIKTNMQSVMVVPNLNSDDVSEIQREVLKRVIKAIKKDIKEMQKMKFDSFGISDANHYGSMETALIRQKIKLEKFRKSLKNDRL